MPDSVALVATIILLLPMIYFFLASPAFLMVKLDIPSVALLLRGMFSGYLMAAAIAAGIGAVAFVLEGRLILAVFFALMSVFAWWSRGWFLRQFDAQIRDRDAGIADAVRRLRRLHVGGMLSNAVQLGVFVLCIPYIVVMPG